MSGRTALCFKLRPKTWPSTFADSINPKVPNLLFLTGGPEMVDFLGSERPPASPKPTGKGGGLRPPPFPFIFREFWEGRGPFGPPNIHDFRPDS